MPKRAFLLLVFLLLGLLILSTPSVLAPLLPPKEHLINTATPTVTVTASATATPDPFAGVPTVTPYGSAADRVRVLPTLAPVATRMPTQMSPTPIASLRPTSTPLSLILPDSSSNVEPVARSAKVTLSADATIPTRIVVPRLNLDAPVEAVGMMPSSAAPDVFEWGVPDTRAAGWLNTSAPFGTIGNTVLDGHHNIKGEVFRDLWTLQAGDEITLFAGTVSQRYVVTQVLILPEKGQSIEVRLRNAQYIQPTADERLTLVTCYPYESNTHRVVVVALPQ